MMHTFRLLHMALEILSGKGLLVNRSHDREELLKIKSGAYSYEELLDRANRLILEIEAAGSGCNLPERLDGDRLACLRISLRRSFDKLAPWTPSIL